MRVYKALFIAPSAYRLGGMQIWLNDIVSYLNGQVAWTVELALVSGEYHQVDAYIAEFPGLPIVRVENKTGSTEGRRQAIVRLLHEREPDVVVGVNIGDLYLAANRAKGKGYRGRTVMSLHGIAADIIADADAQSRLIDAAIATNRLSCRILSERTSIAKGRILYAPYGVSALDPEESSDYSDSIPNNPIRIAWIGRLEQDQKRVWDLLPILKELDRSNLSYQLTIAGDGPERRRIAEALSPWIDSGLVTMTGALSSSRLQSLVYRTHQVLLITSKWETGPIVAWEAMASGLVVVSSTYIGSGLEDALKHNINCLLYPVGDPILAARALADLSDASKRKSLASEGRMLVKSRYSKLASNKSWEQALETVVSRAPLPWANIKEPSRPSGRLDRLAGFQNAERLRQLLRVRYSHQSPGGEWPHTLTENADEQQLLQIAEILDQDT